MATYALIKEINSVETVDNIIVASPEVAATYLVANSGDYDYVIDLTSMDPMPGIGWTYNPGLSEFSPPPEDFEGELEAALLAVDTAIEACVLAYLAAGVEDRSTAVGNVMSELSGSSSSEEIDLILEVVAFLELAAGE